ncbi:hypothetical protein, partial [Alienimonas sp. DA493]|uniref:hypothetical protein n=1 Tax=Alienimonas sp. DA493 TaxID=3373605 RepID=UPI003753F9E4
TLRWAVMEKGSAPPPDASPPGPKLERQIDPAVGRRLGHFGAVVLGVNAYLFLMLGWMSLSGPGLSGGGPASRIQFLLMSAAFVAATATAWRGWVLTTSLLVAAAFVGSGTVAAGLLIAGRWAAGLF